VAILYSLECMCVKIEYEEEISDLSSFLLFKISILKCKKEGKRDV
jgi:hypothetical protein